MTRRTSTVARCGAVALALLSLVAPSASAQRRPAPEFTQQGILVANFSVAGTVTPSLVKNDLRFGRRVGDAVRDRLKGFVKSSRGSTSANR